MLSGAAATLLGRCRFPARGEHIDCAVSGGKDSLALLALAVSAGCRVHAFHVDHQLRPGSGEESDVVAEACEKLGADFTALSVDVGQGPNLEARARVARFEALPQGVATGHTADDQAETILINLMRGAASDGLGAMHLGPRHPILALRRAETSSLVDSLGLAFVTDASNESSAFMRNRVRHELLPLMNEVAKRDLVPLLCRQSELFADESALLDELASHLDPTDASALDTAHVALARRSLRTWLASLNAEGYPPSASSVERVLDVARGEVRAAEIESGTRIARSKGRLRAEPPALNQNLPSRPEGFVR